MHTPTLQTLIVVIVFALGYLFFIIRKAARQQLDIYDQVMLSTVAIVPALFAASPEIANWLAEFVGVLFPFVVMFGMLFAILFIFVHRLTVKLHRLESDSRLLIQEISILKQAIEQPVVRQND
jgi:hypothetical protein